MKIVRSQTIGDEILAATIKKKIENLNNIWANAKAHYLDVYSSRI